MPSEIAPLPAYAPELARRHRAHRPELKRIVRELPIPRGGRVLDAACGDGAYVRWLAERVGDGGAVIGVDECGELIRIGERSLGRLSARSRVRLLRARVESLPFDDDSFDLAWCAQSLISLPHTEGALRELRRVVRPGGTVAVLENDALHDVLLPWPVELELALMRAELAAHREEGKAGARYYIGRRLEEMFLQAELTPIRRSTYAVDRRAPWTPTDLECLAAHLRRLNDRVAPRLAGRLRRQFDALCRPDSPQGFLNGGGSFVTFLHFVVMGAKGAEGAEDAPRVSSRDA